MPLLITTSRQPSRRTRTLAKELNRVIPGSIKLNRGKMSFNKLKEYMIQKGFSKLMIIETRKGNPSILQLLTLSEKGFIRNLIFKINNLIMQMDKNQKVCFTHLSNIKANDVDPILLNIFKYFFTGIDSITKEIRRGFIEIKNEEGQLVITFKDQHDKTVYPFIKGEVISYEAV